MIRFSTEILEMCPTFKTNLIVPYKFVIPTFWTKLYVSNNRWWQYIKGKT